MLIQISGSQGSGKSTIITNLKDAGYNTIERKTSRSILKDWNVELHEVNSDPDLSVKFQEEIIKRKYEDEIEASTSNELWFGERSFADLFTYTIIALGNHNKYSDWLNDYYIKCMKYNQIYTRLYYLRAGMFAVEHDGIRGSNHHYSRMVDVIMLDITKQMIHNSQLQIIETADLTQRINIIKAQSEKQQGLYYEK